MMQLVRPQSVYYVEQNRHKTERSRTATARNYGRRRVSQSGHEEWRTISGELQF